MPAGFVFSISTQIMKYSLEDPLNIYSNINIFNPRQHPQIHTHTQHLKPPFHSFINFLRSWDSFSFKIIIFHFLQPTPTPLTHTRVYSLKFVAIWMCYMRKTIYNLKCKLINTLYSIEFEWRVGECASPLIVCRCVRMNVLFSHMV